MRLSTRIALVASLCMLAVAGLLLTREEMHESELRATLARVLHEGSLNTWNGFVEQALGELDDADLQLQADVALFEALARSDDAAATNRFLAIVSPMIEAHRDVVAQLFGSDGRSIVTVPHGGTPLQSPESGKDGLVRNGDIAAIRNVTPIPASGPAVANAQFTLPIRRLLRAVGTTVRGDAALVGPLTDGQRDPKDIIIPDPSKAALFDSIFTGTQEGESVSLSAFEDRTMLVVRHIVAGAVPGQQFRLVVAWDITESERARLRSEAVALAILIASLALSVGFLHTYMRAALRPLAKTVDVLKAMTAGKIDMVPQLPQRRDEVGELVETVEAYRLALLDRRRLATLQEELSAARHIQQAMLPPPAAHWAGCSVQADIVPARDVGGDFFDYRLGAAGRLIVTIADVAGKGMAAALFIAEARSALRAAAAISDGPAASLAAANGMLARDEEALSFVTVCQIELDPRSGILRIASAGHPPPLWIDASGTSHAVDFRPGRPLGLFAGTTYKESVLTLSLGDRVVLYTDGLTDALGEDSQSRSRTGLADLVASTVDGGAAAIIGSVSKAGVLADDMTCVVLTWIGPSDPR